jgi:hypothetical protein
VRQVALVTSAPLWKWWHETDACIHTGLQHGLRARSIHPIHLACFPRPTTRSFRDSANRQGAGLPRAVSCSVKKASRPLPARSNRCVSWHLLLL